MHIGQKGAKMAKNRPDHVPFLAFDEGIRQNGGRIRIQCEKLPRVLYRCSKIPTLEKFIGKKLQKRAFFRNVPLSETWENEKCQLIWEI